MRIYRSVMTVALATLIAGGAPIASAVPVESPSGSSIAVAPTVPGAYDSLAPARLLDTRNGVGAAKAKVAAGGTVRLQVTGRGGVPASGVSAVVLNVTVTAPTKAGFVTVYGDGTPRPTASNLNFVAAATVPNVVITPIGANGKVALYNGSSGSISLIADVAGYYLSGRLADSGTFASLSPARLLDTRTGVGAAKAKVAAGGTVHLQVTGRGGVRSSQVSAVVLNVTVTAPTKAGFVTVYGDGTPRPTASNLNFVAGTTVPNLVIARVGANGKVALYNGSSGSISLIADVAGYYLSGYPTEAGAFASLSPARLLDTRTGVGAAKAKVAAGGTVHLQVTGRGGVRSSQVSAVVLNVTVTAPTKAGFVTVYGDGTPRPTASNLNFVAGTTVPNLVIARVGANGKVALYNGSSGSISLIADVAGYYFSERETTPPHPVTNLTVKGTTPTSISLSWTNPTDTDLSAIVIRRANGVTAPTTPTSGTEVGDLSLLDTSFADEGLTPGATYSYAVFAMDNVSNYSTRVTISASTRRATTGTLTWGSPTSVDPNGGGFNSVSCPSSSFCVAVDEAGNMVTFNGTSWSAPTSIDPGGGVMTSVSCSSASFCVAVDMDGNAVLFNGSTWSAPVSVNTAVYMVSVSCSSASFCVAAGGGEVVTYNGTSWSDAITIDPISNDISSVSCPSASFCSAVDSDGNVMTYNGTSWSAPIGIDPSVTNLMSVSCPLASFCAATDDSGYVVAFNGHSWSDPTNVEPFGPLRSVSCPTPSFCAATDYAGYVFTYNGTSWSEPRRIDPGKELRSVSCASASFCAGVDNGGKEVRFDGTSWTGPTAIDTAGGLSSVSCPTASFCMAVDINGNVVRFNGTSWSTPTSIASGLAAVSCPSATFCVAVDYLHGQVVTFNGTSWSAPTSIDPDSVLTSVSCPSMSFCVAVDQAGNVITFNGTSWSQPTSIGFFTTLTSVSCSTASFCVAVDNYQSAFTFDGTSWSEPTDVDLPGAFTSVSCPSTSFCVAVDSGGGAVFFNGLIWSTAVNLYPDSYPGDLRSVSCPSATFCAAADYNGQVVTYNGSSWTAPTYLDPNGGGLSLSCASASFCAAVDQEGIALVGRHS